MPVRKLATLLKPIFSSPFVAILLRYLPPGMNSPNISEPFSRAWMRSASTIADIRPFWSSILKLPFSSTVTCPLAWSAITAPVRPKPVVLLINAPAVWAPSSTPVACSVPRAIVLGMDFISPSPAVLASAFAPILVTFEEIPFAIPTPPGMRRKSFMKSMEFAIIPPARDHAP